MGLIEKDTNMHKFCCTFRVSVFSVSIGKGENKTIKDGGIAP